MVILPPGALIRFLQKETLRDSGKTKGDPQNGGKNLSKRDRKRREANESRQLELNPLGKPWGSCKTITSIIASGLSLVILNLSTADLWAAPAARERSQRGEEVRQKCSGKMNTEGAQAATTVSAKAGIAACHCNFPEFH